MSFSPLDPQFEARVRASFARQRAMDTIGATLAESNPVWWKSSCRTAWISRSSMGSCTQAS